MRRMLIADPSEVFTEALSNAFCAEFEVRTCVDGKAVLELLLSFQPDVLILHFSLPFKDGLTVLQETSYVPPVILGITNYISDYVAMRAVSLGVGYILQMPTINTVRVRIADMLSTYERRDDPQAQLQVHLHALTFSSHLDGYGYLLSGIPLFAKDPQQRLTKELYPAIAAQYGCKDPRSIEHAIRTAIESAWKHGDPNVWVKYFPPDKTGILRCPTNKEFISRLAQMLQ